MEMYQDGVRVWYLPDGAICKACEEKQSPLDIDECPMGHDICDGDCFYYDEE